jgi:hypothetical protein
MTAELAARRTEAAAVLAAAAVLIAPVPQSAGISTTDRQRWHRTDRTSG